MAINFTFYTNVRPELCVCSQEWDGVGHWGMGMGLAGMGLVRTLLQTCCGISLPWAALLQPSWAFGDVSRNSLQGAGYAVGKGALNLEVIVLGFMAVTRGVSREEAALGLHRALCTPSSVPPLVFFFCCFIDLFMKRGVRVRGCVSWIEQS